MGKVLRQVDNVQQYSKRQPIVIKTVSIGKVLQAVMGKQVYIYRDGEMGARECSEDRQAFNGIREKDWEV